MMDINPLTHMKIIHSFIFMELDRDIIRLMRTCNLLADS